MSGNHGTNEQEVDAMLAMQPRRISAEQMRKIEGYTAEILAALGMNLDNLVIAATPHRFIQARFDATEGYEGDPKLIKVLATECREGSDCQLSQIVKGPIQFAALYEHHALSFFGQVYVGSSAHEHIIGISTLTRLVRLFARRFAVQERIGSKIADTLNTMMQPHGIGGALEAHHLCVARRGVREMTPPTRSTVWRGEYKKNPALREVFLVACGLRR